MSLESNNLNQILTSYLARTPVMEVQDLYKLLHLAALGSGHIVRDERAVRSWLERELDEMGTGPDDPLIDPLSPDGQILRVHLRPYKREGKNPDKLLQAFIRTANEWFGSPEKLKEYGALAGQMAEKGGFPFSEKEFHSYFAEMESRGFPAVHHSEVYEQLYHPAYRVVARQYFEEI